LAIIALGIAGLSYLRRPQKKAVLAISSSC
jgi:hypothetical protein